MDEQLQRRLIGLVVGVGVVLLLLWMIPGQPPADSSASDSTTVSVTDAARASQTQASTTAPSSSASAASAVGSSAIPPPASAASQSPVPTAAAMSAQSGASANQIPPPAAGPAKPASAEQQASADVRSTGISPTKPSAPLAAALASSLAAKPAPSTTVAAAEPVPAKPVSTIKPATAAVPVPAQRVAVPKPAPKPVTAITPAPVEKAATAASGKGGWYVQVGSFSTNDKAQLIGNLIANSGISEEVAPIKTGSGTTLYRVRSGPYSTSAKADEVLTKLHQQGYPDARRLFE